MCIFAVVNIEESIQRFSDYINTEQRLAQGTVAYYLECTRRFATHLSESGITDTDRIEPRHLREWQMSLVQIGEAPGTVVKNLAALRAWFKFMRRHHIITRDIMAFVTNPKQPKRLPVFFRENEAEYIYSDIFPNTFDGQRDRLVLRMLYETGMRRSELANLTLGDIDTQALTLRVLGKRNKERIIPIENELSHNIARYLALREKRLDELQITDSTSQNSDSVTPRTDILLITDKGKPLGASRIYDIVKRYMSFSTADRVSPHVFRHSFATHMLNEGANIDAIKDLLGHSSLNSTEIYTHVSREHLKETYRHAHPRAQKESKN